MYASATPSLASPNRKRKVSKKAAAPQDPLSTAFSVVFDDEKPNILKDGNGQHSKRVTSKAKSKKPSIFQNSEPTPEVFQHLSSPKADLSHVTNVAFDNLHVCENTKKAIATVMKYQFMTPVQQLSIPVVLDGKDVFVKAKTGTGKTLAFLIPAIEVLIRDRARYTDTTNNNKQESPLILVMSPTRELASQISEEAKQLCFFHKFRIVTFFGGTNMNSDVKKINQGTDIIVATPGRLLTLLTWLILDAKIGAGCRDWCWVRGIALGAEDGVGQGGACFANSLMGDVVDCPGDIYIMDLVDIECEDW